ncbi:MAG: LemA family protein [Candidatus Liptonbacteria bacterium]|nr:LemA family protein [Candidatus Liptonbacteria bacterium]
MSITNIILILIAAVIIWLVFVYNRLITMRNRAKEAMSDIDVQTKRRYDLIPNLVESVKGYMAHERGVFEKVTEARTRAMGATGGKEKLAAENMLSGALKTLFAVAENYPELKANQNFLDLQNELTDTEDKIQAARRFYNTNVRDMNTAIQVFPTNLIAGVFGFKEMEFFESENEAERQPVKVQF